MSGAAIAEPIVTLAEAQAYARIETGEEEALVAGLIRSACALCEAFLGQALIERPFSETVPVTCNWQRLEAAPVREIAQVTHGGLPLSAADYATDIDASGCGWVRIAASVAQTVVEVSGIAGMASDANSVPEPIRQGVLRLVAHLYSARDGHGGEIPAAVTALWRPYRRLRLK